MNPLPDPRLARVVRDLAHVTRLLEELRVEVIEVLREQGVAWPDIADCYEPTVSRQSLQKWVAVRRRWNDWTVVRRERRP